MKQLEMIDRSKPPRVPLSNSGQYKRRDACQVETVVHVHHSGCLLLGRKVLIILPASTLHLNWVLFCQK